METTKPIALEKPQTARFRINPQYLAPLLITGILAVAQITAGVLLKYDLLLTAIGAAIVTEILLSWLWYGRFPHWASAYVTGISIGILVRSISWLPYALCSVLSITSKYVLRVKGRHIWNPSNFGISVLLFTAPVLDQGLRSGAGSVPAFLIPLSKVASVSHQLGNNWLPVAVIWALGLFIVGRLKRLHISLTYIASFLVFGVLRSAITGSTVLAEIAPITGPMYQLFTFFMITDPKTTVQSRRGQMLVAFLVALVEMILRLCQQVHAPYFALFLVGPAANLWEIGYQERKKQRATA
jgi:Na+-transporting NADH:ubiquinone oxidoreductase subunit NqrB